MRRARRRKENQEVGRKEERRPCRGSLMPPTCRNKLQGHTAEEAAPPAEANLTEQSAHSTAVQLRPDTLSEIHTERISLKRSSAHLLPFLGLPFPTSSATASEQGRIHLLNRNYRCCWDNNFEFPGLSGLKFSVVLHK